MVLPCRSYSHYDRPVLNLLILCKRKIHKLSRMFRIRNHFYKVNYHKSYLKKSGLGTFSSHSYKQRRAKASQYRSTQILGHADNE